MEMRLSMCPSILASENVLTYCGRPIMRSHSEGERERGREGERERGSEGERMEAWCNTKQPQSHSIHSISPDTQPCPRPSSGVGVARVASSTARRSFLQCRVLTMPICCRQTDRHSCHYYNT